MYRHIPNFFTSLNLLTGCIGIYYLIELNYFLAAILIFVAAVFDFLDGFSARLLKAYSSLGKSLDSLADLVSFGILPGLLIVKFQLYLTGTSGGLDFLSGHGFYHYVKIFSPLIIPLFSALRLAKFDNDNSQSWEFSGLPTPANALFIGALVWSYKQVHPAIEFIHTSDFVFISVTLTAILMIIPVKFLSLKFRSYSLRENYYRILFILLAVTSIAVWKIPGLFIAISLYILISVIMHLTKGRS